MRVTEIVVKKRHTTNGSLQMWVDFIQFAFESGFLWMKLKNYNKLYEFFT